MLGRSRIACGVGIAALALAAAADRSTAAPGDLDPSFGSGGIALGPAGTARDAALQADGKIVVVGSRPLPPGDEVEPVIARFDSAGNLDLSFGAGGVVALGLGEGELRGVAIQSDGRIVAAGETGADPLLVRFAADGSLDPGFGSGGIVIPDLGSRPLQFVLVQPDGRIVVSAGSTDTHPEIPTSHFIERFEANGTLDTAFASVGVYSLGVGPPSLAPLGRQADGKLIVAGRLHPCVPLCPPASAAYFYIDRLLSGGSLDPAYTGETEFSVPPNREFPAALAVQPDGKVLVSGFADGRGGAFVARFSLDGSFDGGFGQGGVASIWTMFSSGGLVVQSNEKVVFSGAGFVPSDPTHFHLAVGRLRSWGSPDPSWGVAGSVVTPIPGTLESQAVDVLLQPDGKLIAAGTGDDEFVLVRYRGDVPLAPTPSLSASANRAAFVRMVFAVLATSAFAILRRR